MNDVNSVVLVGRLAADPELRDAGQSTVLRFRLAVNRDRKRGEKWEEQAHFFNVDAWNRPRLAEFLHKGSRVAVQGHLELQQWTNAQGEKRSAVQVIASEIEMLDPKSQSYDQPKLERRDVERVPDRSDVPTDDDDIPF